MKQHHKVGNRQGRPAYRTPSWLKNNIKILKNKNITTDKSFEWQKKE
ncbi:hypothetical protein GYA54_00250 [Candidatus Kuenenbacteria bacterium]|nr:hypothetical protein [Candidatus Kuenenbacteria bacterium]